MRLLMQNVCADCRADEQAHGDAHYRRPHQHAD
jgi:hypothetical protein